MAGNMETDAKRIIALIDMDCFYVQVEQREKPELYGKPVAVVQYNQWENGLLLAVSYEARDKGVKRDRSMLSGDAKKACPELVLVSVPTERSKANLSKYRNASAEVFAVLNSYTSCTVERASVDEAYIDLTEWIESEHRGYVFQSLNGVRSKKDPKPPFLIPESFPSTYIVLPQNSDKPREDVVAEYLIQTFSNEGMVHEQKLIIGAYLVEKMRTEVLNLTKFSCSAGISHNKVLAKLACGRNKPRKQTLLPPDSVLAFFEDTKIRKVRNLGGKFGATLVDRFGIETMAELSRISLQQLCSEYDSKTGTWLYNLAKGNDSEPVVRRDLSLSVGCSKNFFGPDSLKTKADVKNWTTSLAENLLERLKEDQSKNQRTATGITCGIKHAGGQSVSHHTALPLYDAKIIAKKVYEVFESLAAFTTKSSDAWNPPVVHLSMSAGKFEDVIISEKMQITNFFKPIVLPHAESVASDKDTTVNVTEHEATPYRTPTELAEPGPIEPNKTRSYVPSPSTPILFDDLDLCPQIASTSAAVNEECSPEPIAGLERETGYSFFLRTLKERAIDARLNRDEVAVKRFSFEYEKLRERYNISKALPIGCFLDEIGEVAPSIKNDNETVNNIEPERSVKEWGEAEGIREITPSPDDDQVIVMETQQQQGIVEFFDQRKPRTGCATIDTAVSVAEFSCGPSTSCFRCSPVSLDVNSKNATEMRNTEVLPEAIDEVDESVWTALPYAIQWELRNFYKANKSPSKLRAVDGQTALKHSLHDSKSSKNKEQRNRQKETFMQNCTKITYFYDKIGD